MKVELKTWATLGLATALTGAGLAGCSEEAGKADRDPNAAPASQAGESGTGEGGESGEGSGGEGGEGGVLIPEAGTDPVVFRIALAVAEAHVVAARDALRAGNREAAAEMFAHPVSEVLLEMEPVFAERGVADLKPLFSGASTKVLEGGSAADIDAKAQVIIASLRDAAEKAPDDGSSEAMVSAGVAADQIERAVAMYSQASEGEAYGPYLDGYGYSQTAQATFYRSAEAILEEDKDLHTRLTDALDLLALAYPSVERPEKLDANQSALSGASSKVMLAIN